MYKRNPKKIKGARRLRNQPPKPNSAPNPEGNRRTRRTQKALERTAPFKDKKRQAEIQQIKERDQRRLNILAHIQKIQDKKLKK